MSKEIDRLKAEIDRIEVAINSVIIACSNPEEISELFKKALTKTEEAE